MTKRKSSLDAGDVASELYNAAESRAQSHGMRLGEGADADIRQYASQAGQMLAKEPIRLDEARAAFERLVDEMMVASHEIPGYREMHAGVIGEDTLARAKARLCPLFPIC